MIGPFIHNSNDSEFIRLRTSCFAGEHSVSTLRVFSTGPYHFSSKECSHLLRREWCYKRISLTTSILEAEQRKELRIDLHVSSDSALSRNQNQDRVADTNPSAVSCRGLDFQFISNCFGTGKLLSTSFLPRGSILYSGVPVEEVCQLSGLLRNEVTLYMTENIISKL